MSLAEKLDAIRDQAAKQVPPDALAEMLSDSGNEYAAKLGLRYRLPDYLEAIYKGVGLDLSKHNGDDSWTLPLPARYVVDTDGIIRVADVNADYTRRPEPEKTVEDVRALAAGS
jgi:peroxiredoxin